jgi:hypothetical protein
LTSDVAEVAVGCGGKTKEGKWLSFMCFNLGADPSLGIDGQKNFNISFTNDYMSGHHPYTTGEEDVYGDFFQWGRIADGHEERNGGVENFASLSDGDIGSGGICSSVYDLQNRPTNQIKKTSPGYGKFIRGGSNWNPISDQATINLLWSSGRRVDNDPCAHYEEDGSYHEFWHADGESSSDPACGASNTNWRIPTQAEWSELYRGGTLFGLGDDAEANTWYWNLTLPGGYELLPDGVTTTLFLPANGFRLSNSGGLNSTGTRGLYWSSTATNNVLSFSNNYVDPTVTLEHSLGLALRCIKN